MKLTNLALAMMSALTLAACGGGGGSDSSSGNTTNNNASNNENNGSVVDNGNTNASAVTQAVQLDAYSDSEVASASLNGDAINDSETTICLDTDNDESCIGEKYTLSGKGLSFNGTLQWPSEIDASNLKIVAENDHFTYAVPASAGQSGAKKLYLNPVTGAANNSKIGTDALLSGYTGSQYTAANFDPTVDYASLEPAIKALGDTVSALPQNLTEAEYKNVLSGSLNAIIEALNDAGVSNVQIVLNVINNGDYSHINGSSTDGNSAPTAQFTVEVGEDGWVQFTNASSDPDNDNLTYRWKFGDGSESAEVSPKHQYTSNRSYSVYLGVTDGNDLSAYASKHINIDSVPGNISFAASFTANVANDGTGAVSVVNTSNVENVKAYRWDFGDKTGAVTGQNPSHTYAQSGTYTIRLQVVTESGYKYNVSNTVDVQVKSIEPVNKTAVPSFTSSVANGKVSFTNTSTDAVSYSWNFGDGTTSTEANPTHTYSESGSYNVVLTAKGSDGKAVSTSSKVTVSLEDTPVKPDDPKICEANDPFCKGDIDPAECQQICTTKSVETCESGTNQSTATQSATTQDASSTALSSIEMDGVYATNPNGGVGVNKTITSMSDWTSDMLIARGAANDDPRAYRGYHEKATDLYGLYAAWDDDNLYLMVEMPNLDNVELGSDFDYSNDKFLPMGIGIRTGVRTTGDGEMDSGTNIWMGDKFYSIKEGVDAILMFHPQEYGTPGLFLAKDGKFTYDTKKEGYLLSFKEAGITISGGVDGSVSSTYMGVSNNYGKDSNAWKTDTYTDLKAEKNAGGHLYQVTIPLKALGITKSHVETNGISVMAFSTFGESMMDALPWTPSLVDAASEAYSKDDSTSHEKEDVDDYDVHLASVGKLVKAGASIDIHPAPVPVCTTKEVTTCTPETLPESCSATIVVALTHSEAVNGNKVTSTVNVATGYKGVTYTWTTSDGQKATTAYDGTSKTFNFTKGKQAKNVTITVKASNASGSKVGSQSVTVTVPACSGDECGKTPDNKYATVLEGEIDSNIFIDKGDSNTCKTEDGSVILKYDGFSNPTLWLYKDATTNYTGGKWPGAAMAKVEGCTSTFYSYKPSESVSSASAIFSDNGANQYPYQNQAGVEFTTAKPCYDFEAKTFKTADECGLAAAVVDDSAYIYANGKKVSDGTSFTITEKEGDAASGYKDVALMMAGKGVNANTTGTFYFGDDASSAATFVNGQKIRIGENITAAESAQDAESIKLTVVYNDAKATYTFKKVKYTKTTASTQFAWNNALMYFVVTDRFYDGDKTNNNSYDRPSQDTAGKTTATFHGGDIKGLTERLDYIKSLGMNSIWITAPYEQAHGWTGGGSSGSFAHYAYHGYYALDFTSMDANMGTVEDFRNFVKEAHKRGIRVVVDVVMNHSGYATLKDMCEFGFGATKDGWDACKEWVPGNGQTYHQKPISEDANSKWDSWWGANWLRFGAYGGCGGDDLTTCTSYLPDFKNEANGGSVSIPTFLKNKWSKPDSAHDIPAAKKYREGSMSVADFEAHWLASWVEEFGIDGFRCDTAKHVQQATWKKLHDYSEEALKTWRANNAGGDDPAASWTDDFYMTGEHFGFRTDPSDGSGYGKNGGFTAMINFELNGNSSNHSSSSCTDPMGKWAAYAQQFNNGTSAPALNALTYVSSHDTSLCRPSDMKNLGTGLDLLPGGVQVFYGDETARPNDNGGSGNDAEHGTRSDMNFPSDIGNQEAWAANVDTLSTSFSSNETLAHWQKVGQFRFRNVAVGAGAQTKLDDGSLCRQYNDGQGIDNAVVIHVGSASTISVGDCFADGTELQDGYSGATGTVSGGKVTLSGTKDLILLELKR